MFLLTLIVFLWDYQKLKPENLCYYKLRHVDMHLCGSYDYDDNQLLLCLWHLRSKSNSYTRCVKFSHTLQFGLSVATKKNMDLSRLYSAVYLNHELKSVVSSKFTAVRQSQSCAHAAHSFPFLPWCHSDTNLPIKRCCSSITYSQSQADFHDCKILKMNT